MAVLAHVTQCDLTAAAVLNIASEFWTRLVVTECNRINAAWDTLPRLRFKILAY